MADENKKPVEETAVTTTEPTVETTPVKEEAPVVETTPTPTPVVEEKKVEAVAPAPVETKAPEKTEAKVEPVVAAPVEEKKVEPVKVVEQPVSTGPVFTKTVGNVTPTNMMVSTINETFDRYIEAMKPGVPMPAKIGARNQYSIYKLLMNVCNLEVGFKESWDTVLAVFNKHKEGALQERYVYRFAEELPGTIEEHNNFHRLLNLIILTADPATRKDKLKEVSIYKTTQDGFSELARNNLNNFYK